MRIDPLTAYQSVVLIAACGHAIVAASNFVTFRKPRAPVTGDEFLPPISVLVPARNEEEHIEACVRSLLAQNYPKFEVLVLDDGSSDATWDIVHGLRDEDDRVRLLVGAELQEGWCGKPHACWQLAKAARGKYLLFTDADCRFAPDALLLAVGAAQEHDADVVSLMPDYVAVGFWEKVIIPVLVLIPFLFLPMFLIRKSNFALTAGANGSFIYLSHDNYFACGGHEAVKDQLAEDVKFSQCVKRAGLTLWYGDGKKAYSVRMYQSLAEIWRGFTRNLFPAFSRKLSIMIPVLLWILCVMILPPFFALVGVLLGAHWAWIAALAYGILVAIRLLIFVRLDRDEPWAAFLNPLSWGAAFAIALGSIRAVYGQGPEWKGRTYAKPKPPK